MGMTIDEAIERYSHNAEYERVNGNLQGCLEFRQLVEWLKDYEKLKEQEPYVDCIDRAGAMTEIMISKNIASFDGEYWIKTKDATQIIRELPSVKQEQESCEGCVNKTEIHCQYSDKEIAKSFIEDVETVKEFLPCGEQMEFPSTFDEFAKDYGFVDKKEIYTNGSELIPIFRVKQWLEHIKTEQKSDVFDKIKAEMQSYSDSFVLAKRNDLANAVSYCIEIIDKYGDR